MEYRGVGGVQGVGAVDPPWGNDADGGLPLFHGPHLHPAGLGPQKNILRDVKGVLGVPGRVILGEVQGLKVVVVGFHLGAVHHIEAHAQKDLLHLVQHQGDGVTVAGGRGGTRHGDVNGLGPQLLLQEGSLKGLGPGGEFPLHRFPDLVGQLADDRTLLGGKPPHPFQDGGKLPFLAQELDPKVVQLLEAFGLGKLLMGRSPDRFQCGFHAFSSSFQR